MAINKGIIQVRRGLKEDLQSDKLLPGELAIATDAPCMWFCWSPGNVEQLPTSDNVIDVIIETVNQYLANNDITVISDGFMREYDGWIQYSADNKTWKNVIAVAELIGENGGYYTPTVTDNGDLTWTPSSDGMEPLPSVNIRGPEAELTKESVENALGYAPLKSADVVDNLLGNSGKLPLSDKQGKVLDEKISELNTKLSAVGTLHGVSGKITLPNSYLASAGQINLTAGTWLVTLHAYSETSNASGYMEIWIATTTSHVSGESQNEYANGTSAYNNSYPRLATSRILKVDETTAVYGRYFQNSGSDREVHYKMSAVKIA